MLVIGLDGATWEVINPNLRKLTNFNEILKKYPHSTIHLTQKPWSASVWTSMFSGKTPEEHKHYDFVKNGRVQTRKDIKVDFIWDILEEKGINIKALNIPFIVPPYNFGIKFTPPGKGVPLTQKELDSEITLVTNEIIKTFDVDHPDLMIAVYTALDKMSHLHWGESSLVEYYQKIDQALGKIITLDNQVLIISDHGFTDYSRAPIQTLPKKTSTGNILKGDHHPDAICITKNIPFKVKQPMDVFKGLLNYFK